MGIINTVSTFTPSLALLSPTQDFTRAALSRILANNAKSSSTTATDTSSSTQNTEQTTTTSSATSSFDSILNALLPASQYEELNEEQLFSALIEERLTTRKGAACATAYHQLFTSYQGSMVDANGNVRIEEAARAALNDLATDGTLSTEEAETIHSQAFQAAQIDGNSGALYDSLGTTMAVTCIESALASSRQIIAAFDAGETEAGRLSLDYDQENGSAEFVGGSTAATTTTASSTTSTAFVGGDGFLFKPISESNGTLVILLPAAMNQDVDSVTLTDSTGQTLETGNAYDTFEDGRPIFRFDQPGANYPDNLTVTVTMQNGSTRTYNIPDPSQRYA